MLAVEMMALDPFHYSLIIHRDVIAS